MIIKALSENTAVSPEFETEHGLSLYIESKGRRILFDTGRRGVFIENARKLGVDISDVDMAVISHGHNDHGGGIKLFLKENSRAPVYVHPKAFGKYYSKRKFGMESIGLNKELIKNSRITLTTEHFFAGTGIEIFSNVTGREYFSESNNALLAKNNGKIIEDSFEHEQNLIITEDNKTVLFAGCSHNGIVNILNRFLSLKEKYPDYVFGGFHLSNPDAGTSESPELIGKIGEALNKTGSKYYTCHCTGTESYECLKGIMGDNIEYIAAGSVIEI
jgi:7,8-dihydropterin-6-yl-methyl-4-(beta-D-ribofuranosyl)aminobenzene 5'-phosphate synthase